MAFRLIVSDLGNLPLDYLNRLDLSYFENGRVFLFSYETVIKFMEISEQLTSTKAAFR